MQTKVIKKFRIFVLYKAKVTEECKHAKVQQKGNFNSTVLE